MVRVIVNSNSDDTLKLVFIAQHCIFIIVLAHAFFCSYLQAEIKPRDRNAIFRNYCVAIGRKNCKPATRCDGKICWQINCQNTKSFQYFSNFWEDIALPQGMLHKKIFTCNGNVTILENFFATAGEKLLV